MLSGFTIVRNAITLDFPIVPAIRSVLEVCDEVVVNVGRSDDGTRDVVAAIADPRVRILDSEWDFTKKNEMLSIETLKAMHACRGDWGIYIQADEVLHETGARLLKERVGEWDRDERVEGLLVDYRHFYAGFELVATSRRWYRREVRAIRLRRDIRPYQGAQGFRVGPGYRKIRARRTGAEMFHYGWARPARRMDRAGRAHRRPGRHRHVARGGDAARGPGGGRAAVRPVGCGRGAGTERGDRRARLVVAARPRRRALARRLGGAVHPARVDAGARPLRVRLGDGTARAVRDARGPHPARRARGGAVAVRHRPRDEGGGVVLRGRPGDDCGGGGDRPGRGRRGARAAASRDHRCGDRRRGRGADPSRRAAGVRGGGRRRHDAHARVAGAATLGGGRHRGGRVPDLDAAARRAARAAAVRADARPAGPLDARRGGARDGPALVRRAGAGVRPLRLRRVRLGLDHRGRVGGKPATGTRQRLVGARPRPRRVGRLARDPGVVRDTDLHRPPADEHPVHHPHRLRPSPRPLLSAVPPARGEPGGAPPQRWAHGVARPAGSSPVLSRCSYTLTYPSACVTWVNQRSACARHACGSRVSMVREASISSSSVSPSAPTSSVSTSGSAPRRVATTGVPENRASMVVRPNGSSHSAGIHRQRAPASSSAFSLPSTSPTNLIRRENVGRQPPASTRRRPVRFAASMAQWYPLALCSRPMKKSYSSFRSRNTNSRGSSPAYTNARWPKRAA